MLLFLKKAIKLFILILQNYGCVPIKLQYAFSHFVIDVPPSGKGYGRLSVS